LNETEDKSKSKEKRLEERKKVVAETQRSYAVAEMKKAHKLIEDTEKSRKLPAIRSICQRIDAHAALLVQRAPMFGNNPFGGNPVLAENIKHEIRTNGRIYESIRYDFQKTLDVKEEDMEKLFPRIEIKMETGYWVTTCYITMIQQLRQMRAYCERMF
jgi:ribosomal protein S20